MKYILMRKEFGHLEEVTWQLSKNEMLSFIQDLEDDDFVTYYIVTYISNLEDFKSVVENNQTIKGE